MKDLREVQRMWRIWWEEEAVVISGLAEPPEIKTIKTENKD